MTSATGPERPAVEFFVLTPDTKIESASRTVIGSLPTRAEQLCAPVTTASGHGWYVYPPIDFALRWSGQTTEFSLLEDNEPASWVSLAGFYDATLPQSDEITATVPDRLRPDWDKVHEKWSGRLPFCSADPRAPNHVEIVTGVVARTPPGWALLVRGVANWPGGVDHVTVEGVVETEWYRSMLPTMVRLLHQDTVVRFYRRFPFAMLQLVPAVAYDRGTLAAAVIRNGVAEFPDDVWDEHITKRLNRSRQPGDYARQNRQHGRDRKTE